MGLLNEAGKTIPIRAERITTKQALLYRSPGEIAWHRANTENISRSGVLFKGDKIMPVNKPVEMALELVCLTPMKLASVANVLWYGNVVRTVQPGASDTASAIAATLSEFTFLSDKSSSKF